MLSIGICTWHCFHVVLAYGAISDFVLHEEVHLAWGYDATKCLRNDQLAWKVQCGLAGKENMVPVRITNPSIAECWGDCCLRR